MTAKEKKLLNKVKRLNNLLLIQDGISNKARIQILEHNAKIFKIAKKLISTSKSKPLTEGNKKSNVKKYNGVGKQCPPPPPIRTIKNNKL